ncbi:MAG TPA: hypothetical protein VMF30_08050, partial [Pirellulales bacterium]|nr:hypothetical protein [Pirellulales bacterium]
MRSFANKGSRSSLAVILFLAGPWGFAPRPALASNAPSHTAAQRPRFVLVKSTKESKTAKKEPSTKSRKRTDDSNERVKEPTTFAEAFERGKQSLD